MSAIPSVRRTVREVTDGQEQVGLPMLGAARTDRPLTESRNGDWILPLIKRAQERTMSQKAALITMEIAKTQYIDSLNGVGHLSVRKLGLLDQDFWRALIEEIEEHFGLNDYDRQLERALDCMQRGAEQVATLTRQMKDRR